MNAWKEILTAVGDHLEEIRSLGIVEISLPPRDTTMPAATPARAERAPATARADASVQASPAREPVAAGAAPEPRRIEVPPVPRRPSEAPQRSEAPSPPPSAPSDAPATEPDSIGRIAAELEGCRRCRLCEGRTNIVVGDGNPHARLMFVGEGPGEEEDRQGLPFVGAAGQLLTKIIEAMGLDRGDVYIANVVKCRPPNNRTPMLDEVESCYPFLRRQIAAVNPEVIVSLGAPASQALLNVSVPISRLRGTFYKYGNIEVMPTFHPAYLLRNPGEKRAVWQDIQQVMQKLGLSPPGK